MNPVFVILAIVTVAGFAMAMTLRGSIHCILALALGLVGLAGLFVHLDAQFVGFTQVLVYVGAVAILAVFAIMMTQSVRKPTQPVHSASWVVGVAIAIAVFATIGWAIVRTAPRGSTLAPPQDVAVSAIGAALMHRYALPLEITGLLLTAALLGAVVVAMQESGETR